MRGGAFDIPGEVARSILREPTNVNGRTNADVVLPWPTGTDVVKRPRDMFIIDFGTDMSEPEAAAYETPFAHVEAVAPTPMLSCLGRPEPMW